MDSDARQERLRSRLPFMPATRNLLNNLTQHPHFSEEQLQMKRECGKNTSSFVFLLPGPVPGLLDWACPKNLGQAQSPANWCWAIPYVHAQIGSRSFTKLRVRRLRTNCGPRPNNVPHTSRTTRSTRSNGFGWRILMLAWHHHYKDMIRPVQQSGVVKEWTLAPSPVFLWTRVDALPNGDDDQSAFQNLRPFFFFSWLSYNHSPFKVYDKIYFKITFFLSFCEVPLPYLQATETSVGKACCWKDYVSNICPEFKFHSFYQWQQEKQAHGAPSEKWRSSKIGLCFPAL